MVELKLFNPYEHPFGSLSNQYKDNLIIHGKSYSTVSNYIYANMLRRYNIIVHRAKPKDIQSQFEKIYENNDKNSSHYE